MRSVSSFSVRFQSFLDLKGGVFILFCLGEKDQLPEDPFQRALHLLHVGATPETLPCREEQFAEVLVKVEGVIEGGGGGCVCAF